MTELLRLTTAGDGVAPMTRALRPGFPLRVGRDPSSDVQVTSRTVSRRHLTIASAEGGVVVEVLSHNGVRVDGRVVGPGTVRLTPPARITVGGALLAIARHRPEEADVDPDCPALRRVLHRALLDRLDLPRADDVDPSDPALRQKVDAALRAVIGERAPGLGAGERVEALVRALTDEVLGLGALEPLLADRAVSEIMVVDPKTIFVERAGKITKAETTFSDAEALRAVIERIVTPLGRRIDESNPLVDARLKDGSRVNAVIPPLAVKGPCLTIRRFGDTRIGMEDLVRFGSMSEAMARFLDRCVRVRRNIVVSGGTGSGKTTLLGALSQCIPDAERIVTVEDAAELRLAQEHVVTLESRPPSVQGTGGVSIRDLVKNALRMRPDRIIVGECRGGEALDMLQAMNTGHDGSMTTTHANSPSEAVSRLETLALMSGLDLPARAIRSQVASSVHLVVQQSRFSDGSRRVVSIAEILGIDERGEVETADVFKFVRTGTSTEGEVLGEYRATGHLPSFVQSFIEHGLASDGDCL